MFKPRYFHVYYLFFCLVKALLSFLIMAFAGGCASYKISTREISQTLDQDSKRLAAPDCFDVNENAAFDHPLYNIIPRHRSQIRWYDAGHWTTWMLFGNDDDGIFGEARKKPYKPDQPPGFQKALVWFCRKNSM